MKTAAALALAGAMAAAGQAPQKRTSGGTQIPETMTRMVVRLSGPGIRAQSYASLPKTIYAAPPHFGRVEDAPDAKQKQQKLLVIAEPDAYSVNLIDRHGTHAVDKGSADGTDLHLPIVLPFDPAHRLGVLDRIEFGDEVDFFRQAGAKKVPGPIVNAKTTEALELMTQQGAARLIVRSEPETPIFFEWPSGQGTYKYEYIEFQEMPFDTRLFARPAGITWKEIKTPLTPEPGA